MKISEREIDLVREQGETMMESFAYRHLSPSAQPAEWHDGRRLLRLARKLERYRKAGRREAKE